MFLRVGGLSKTFISSSKQRTVVFDSFSVDVEFTNSAQVIAICGPSGCGKTTLLRVLAGTQAPDHGSARVVDEGIEIQRSEMATVPQKQGCFPWLTAAENVEYGLRIRNVDVVERQKRTQELLDKVGLREKAATYPSTLSGGMLQRVSVARALALRPRLLLLDEPFAALDPQTKRDIQALTLRLIEEAGSALVLVTHDPSEALLMADHVIVLPMRPVRSAIASYSVGLERPRSAGIVYSPEFADELRRLDAMLSIAATVSGSSAVSGV